MKNIRENPLFRRIQSFINNIAIPFIIKAILIFIALIILIFFSLKFFKPAYLDKIYKNSSYYFLHYLNLDNYQFKDIKISGNNRASKEQIISTIHYVEKHMIDKKSDDYQPFIKRVVEQVKKDSPWVKNIVVTRTMPSNLKIEITEYEPFALWQDGGKKYVIDREGTPILIDDLSEFEHMIILTGKGANTHARSLFNILAIDEKLSSEIYSASWVGGRRWNVRLESNTLVKLPENNIITAWQRLAEIYAKYKYSFGDIKVIDLRITDKLYLEYEDSRRKDLEKI